MLPLLAPPPLCSAGHAEPAALFAIVVVGALAAVYAAFLRHRTPGGA